MKKIIIRSDGLTEQEGKAMDALVKAWNTFSKLDCQHPSDTREFNSGVHQCQHILMCRVLRRDYPKGYPTHSG